jgi:hypothetical protein
MASEHKCECPDCRGTCKRRRCPWCLRMRENEHAACVCGFGRKPVVFTTTTDGNLSQPIPYWRHLIMDGDKID